MTGARTVKVISLSRRASIAAATLALLLGPGAARANRDIVFSAQYYRWAGYYRYPDDGTKHRTLDDKGPYHLYRINPDGTRRTRITSGKWDDLMPRWSPDGKQILFAREQPKQRMAICTVAADGGTVKKLHDVGEGFRYGGHYSWSPDGRRVAVDGAQGVTILDRRNGSKNLLAKGDEFAWSPDGRLFVTFSDWKRRAKRCEIWTFSGTKPRRVRTISSAVWNPLWLDNRSILGDKPDDESYELTTLRTISADSGTIRRSISLRPERHRELDEDETTGFYVERRRWQRVPKAATKLLLEAGQGMSDGMHYFCHLIDMPTGRFREVRHGMLLGISPDGKRCAIADHQWVGPYKRGGRRCGPLEIVDLKTGKTRKITTGLVAIAGGDWLAPSSSRKGNGIPR